MFSISEKLCSDQLIELLTYNLWSLFELAAKAFFVVVVILMKNDNQQDICQ